MINYLKIKKNVLYESKHTKFSLEKCNNDIYKKTDIKEKSKSKIDRKLNISEKCLIQKANNCRYNAYITLFYFTISPYLIQLKDENLSKLNQLNELILKLADNVNEENYYNIIVFLQKNKSDSNNKKIDEIINECDWKKELLLKI